MLSKRGLVVMLAILNGLLLLGLILSVTGLPGAYAQLGGPRPGDFIAVTAEASSGVSDALYIIDVPEHKLHLFIPEGPQTHKLAYMGSRDLEKDFGKSK
ncbi:MAG TPA: hypothetical protein VGM03_13280 [Phycisphaerae bacterium]